MKSLSKPGLLGVLKVAREQSEQDWLMLAMTYIYGTRVSETLALTPANFKHGFVRIQALKSGLTWAALGAGAGL